MRVIAGFAASLVLAVLLPTTAAASPRWAAFKQDSCTAPGKRQFSARLMNIRGDWMRACKATSATIRGQRFARPTRCKNLGAGGMWGEFDVNDASCKARWGELKRDACTKIGVRQYSARLWDIPGSDWAKACRSSIATVGSRRLAPARCKNLGAGGVWGEFNVPDTSCPYWGNETGKAGVERGACAAVNYRTYYARLWDLPAGVDWTNACHAEPQLVAGYQTPQPSACISKGPLGMWGEWLVKDTSCTEASLPQDERRRALANATLKRLAHVVAEQVGLVQKISADRDVKAKLDAGNHADLTRWAESRAADALTAGSDGYLLRTMTIGAVVGAKAIIFGSSGEAGAAIDLEGKRPVYAYASGGYEWGLGLAAGAGVNVGFWVCQNNKIGGDVWGLQFGLDDILKLSAAAKGKLAKKPPTRAKKPPAKGKPKKGLEKGLSLTVGLWFDYDNVFQGFTFTPAVGVGANLGGIVYASTAVDGDDTIQCDGSPK